MSLPPFDRDVAGDNDARRWLAKHRAASVRPTLRMSKGNLPPVEQLQGWAQEYYADLGARNLSLHTIDFYRERLSPMIAQPWLAESFIRGDGAPFRAWLVQLKQQGTGPKPRPVSDSYVEQHRRAASAFCNWLVAEGRIARSPLDRVRTWHVDQHEIQVLSADEVRRLFDTQSLNGFEGPRNRTILAVLYGTGIRVGELVRAEISSVEATGHLRVIGKARRERRIPLSAGLQEILLRYLALRGLRTGGSTRLFVSAAGATLQTNSVNQWMTHAARRAGITRRVYPHLWRHTFATEYLRRGGDPLRLQKILGHASLKMLTRYVHYVQADLDGRIDELSPLDALIAADALLPTNTTAAQSTLAAVAGANHPRENGHRQNGHRRRRRRR